MYKPTIAEWRLYWIPKWTVIDSTAPKVSARGSGPKTDLYELLLYSNTTEFFEYMYFISGYMFSWNKEDIFPKLNVIMWLDPILPKWTSHIWLLESVIKGKEHVHFLLSFLITIDWLMGFEQPSWNHEVEKSYLKGGRYSICSWINETTHIKCLCHILLRVNDLQIKTIVAAVFSSFSSEFSHVWIMGFQHSSSEFGTLGSSPVLSACELKTVSGSWNKHWKVGFISTV